MHPKVNYIESVQISYISHSCEINRLYSYLVLQIRLDCTWCMIWILCRACSQSCIAAQLALGELRTNSHVRDPLSTHTYMVLKCSCPPDAVVVAACWPSGAATLTLVARTRSMRLGRRLRIRVAPPPDVADSSVALVSPDAHTESRSQQRYARSSGVNCSSPAAEPCSI
jgi:hypothetical protein